MRNLYDEVWESGSIDTSTGENTVNANIIRTKNYIPVKPNTTYYMEYTGSGSLSSNGCYYGADQSYINYMGNTINKSFTTPANCYFIRFYLSSSYGTTYNNDIKLYSPQELRGLFKLNGNSLYCDGDILEGNKVTRKWVVLPSSTTISWSSSAVNDGGYIRFVYTVSPAKKYGVENVICNLLANKGSLVQQTDTAEWISGYASGGGLYVMIKASNLSGDMTTETGRRTAFNDYRASTGMTFYYEVATATTETTEEYISLQKSFPNGTETYIDTRDVPIPVGHITDYHRDGQPFLNDLGDYADWNGTNVALKEMVGGTLRNLLSVKSNLAFDNTAWIDLGTITDWGKSTVDGHTRFSSETLHPLVKWAGDIVCTKYPQSDTHTASYTADKVVATSGSSSSNARTWIWDDSYSDVASFKASLKGVILAYEKA